RRGHGGFHAAMIGRWALCRKIKLHQTGNQAVQRFSFRPEGAEMTHVQSRYHATHARSLADPDAFWREAAAALDWTRPFERVLDDRNPPFYRWFAGGGLNICDNALDRHVRRGDG